MLENFTSDTFAPLTGQVFRAVPASGEPFELVCSACEETRYGPPEQWSGNGRRVPFSLLFHARDGRYVPQQTFMLHHPDLGEFPLFLVPLGPDGDGMRYEAVIS